MNVPAGRPAAEPVFVCGLGRSGTTWISTSLGQSPELTYIREAWLLERLGDLVDWFSMLHEEWSSFTPWRAQGIDRRAVLERVAQLYGDLLLLASGGRRLVEKTPDWNVLQLDLLHELFPSAYYLLIYRDGRNQVASLEAKREAKGEPFDFAAACRRWARAMDVVAAVEAGGSIDRLKVVRYEDLLEDFESIFRDVCRFVEVEPFEPSAYRPNSAFGSAPGSEDFNRRWASWPKGRRATFKRAAGEQLVAWGYAESNEW